MLQLGVIADIHGDWASFVRAIHLFTHAQVSHILCAGDIVDRGTGADRIVEALQKLPATAVKGNHEHTILRSQERWRASARATKLAQVGRIISDDTLAFIAALPDSAQLTFAGVRILLAHGTPWSDIMDMFPDSRQGKFDQLVQRYGDSTDVIVLGHTHHPMHVRTGRLRVLNPGSVYGVTARDSHTCAILSLPDCSFQVFDLATYEAHEIPIMER
jgi:putative phosphoesterase